MSKETRQYETMKEDSAHDEPFDASMEEITRS